MTAQIHGLNPVLWHRLRPAGEMPAWPWICRYGRAPSGEPFDPDDVPWTRGVCEAFDDPRIRMIVLQWAARMAKTTIGHLLLQYAADMRPADMLIGLPTEQLSKATIKRKLYRAIERNARLASRIPPRRLRSQYLVDLADCIIKGAWPSESQLADYSAVISLASEADKWEQSGDDEGDPLDQFLARSFEHPDRKNIVESTPHPKGRSRVEVLRREGTDSRLWVPCPHCDRPQELEFGDGDRRNGGIIFDKDEHGRLDAEIAYHTAVYVCRHCDGEITDPQRPAMIRACVWADRGQVVMPGGEIVGPRRDVHVWSSQLSALYSLRLRWGDLAARFVRSRKSPGRRKTWVQLTIGANYQAEDMLTDEDLLAQRLAARGDMPRGMVPKWGKMLVLVSDVQKASWPWVVLAFGDRDRSHLVDWGTAFGWDEIDTLLGREYAHADGGHPMRAIIAGVDSSDGNRTKEIYRWCSAHHSVARPVLPLKGSSGDLSGKPYQLSILGRGNRSRRRTAQQHAGQQLFIVNTDQWEDALQGALESGDLSACTPACKDRDLLSQLLNATYEERTDRRGRTTVLWRKREESEPNDFRDAPKYGLCLAQYVLDLRRGQWPPRGPVKQASRSSKPRLRPLTGPGGQPFLVTQR